MRMPRNIDVTRSISPGIRVMLVTGTAVDAIFFGYTLNDHLIYCGDRSVANVPLGRRQAWAYRGGKRMRAKRNVNHPIDMQANINRIILYRLKAHEQQLLEAFSHCASPSDLTPDSSTKP